MFRQIARFVRKQIVNGRTNQGNFTRNSQDVPLFYENWNDLHTMFTAAFL